MSQTRFNLEEFIAPIPGDLAQGVDIRVDASAQAEYYAAKDARNNASALERTHQFDDDIDLISPWYEVQEKSEVILKTLSKDLQACTWYCEASVRIDGAFGLKNSFQLIEAIINEYWDVVYPEPDEYGLETKIAPLEGLGSGPLLAPMRSITITEGNTGESYSYAQYLQARDASKIQDDKERKERFETIGFSFENVENEIKSSTPTYFIELTTALEAALSSFKEYNNTLRKHCGGEAPPSSDISNLLEELIRTVRFISKDIVDAHNAAQNAQQALQETIDDQTNSSEAGAVVTTGNLQNVQFVQQVPAGAITNREDALKQLSLISDYFRMYEPHTPLAASLDRIIKWGRMTLPELILELIPDQNAKALYSQLTGVVTDGTATDKYVPPPQPVAVPTQTNTAADTSHSSEVETKTPETPKQPETQSSSGMGW